LEGDKDNVASMSQHVQTCCFSGSAGEEINGLVQSCLTGDKHNVPNSTKYPYIIHALKSPVSALFLLVLVDRW
jgi:hypothetical protein